MPHPCNYMLSVYCINSISMKGIEMLNLYTLGMLAKELDEPAHCVAYALRDIEPAATLSGRKIYTADQVPQIARRIARAHQYRPRKAS